VERILFFILRTINEAFGQIDSFRKVVKAGVVYSIKVSKVNCQRAFGHLKSPLHLPQRQFLKTSIYFQRKYS
jgi:hypothetical protein